MKNTYYTLPTWLKKYLPEQILAYNPIHNVANQGPVYLALKING
jgi:hypothetical protein